jgi:hypothetical protein
MRQGTNLVVHGAIAGGLAAACMTVMRMAAHRAGWIRQMVPQSVAVWALDEKLDLPRRPAALDHLADQVLHVGYGAAAGALYAAAAGRGRRSIAGRGVGLGLPLWAFGNLLLLPALGIAKPAWRSRASETAVNIGAHLLYGVATALVTDEFERQKVRQPRSYPRSRNARLG